MKILSNRSNKAKSISIDIIAVLDSEFSSADSARNVDIEKRELDFKYQLSDKQFEAYVNFIKSAVSTIDAFGFNIVEEYQSNISYSYYVQFTPEPYKGFEDQMLELDVKFRLSDHYNSSTSVTKDMPKTKSSGVIFRSFVVEGVVCDSIAAALLEIKEICKDLKVGDYSRL